MKKLVAVLLTAAVAVSAALTLTACSESEFPVEVANYKIEKEPKNVVVLDAVTADIMAYMSYNSKFAGRSDAVTQPELAAAPTVGSESEPDVPEIKALGADLVFCNEKLSKETAQQLTNAGIPVITLQTPETVAEVKTNYETIAKVLSGKNKGMRLGKEAYSQLELELERQEHSVEGYIGPNDNATICYLYLDGKNLSCLTNGTYGDILMSYTGFKNIFSYGDATPDSPASVDIVKGLTDSNPYFILYHDDATLKALKANKTLAKLKAVAANRVLQIPLQQMSLPGVSARHTLDSMIASIYKGKLPATDPAPATDATSGTNVTIGTAPSAAPTTAAATAATTAATTAPQDVSSQYKITLKDLKLAKNDENDNVKIMQQRLFDLGYITQSGEDTNITGYYGDVTETAVKAFQKANGLTESGEADNATLVLLFSNAAKKAS